MGNWLNPFDAELGSRHKGNRDLQQCIADFNALDRELLKHVALHTHAPFAPALNGHIELAKSVQCVAHIQTKRISTFKETNRISLFDPREFLPNFIEGFARLFCGTSSCGTR